MTEHVCAGFDPAQFWALSPRLYDLQMRAARERDARDRQLRRAEQWNAEALRRARKMPDFDRYVAKPRSGPVKRQSRAELQAMLAALAARWAPDKAKG